MILSAAETGSALRNGRSPQPFMISAPYPRYEVLPVDGGSAGRSVVITFENGQTETRLGFRSEADARAWIEKDMLMRPRRP